MTTTTPESRARIAYTAYLRESVSRAEIASTPMFDELTDEEKRGWLNASRVLWDLATTGQAEL